MPERRRQLSEQQRTERERDVATPACQRLMAIIRARRAQRGMTVEELALRAGIGIRTYPYVDRSNGTGRTQLSTFIRIAYALGYEVALIDRQEGEALPLKGTVRGKGRIIDDEHGRRAAR